MCLHWARTCMRSDHALGSGGRTLYLTHDGQHVSRVAVQREAMLGPRVMLRVFAACRSDVSPLG